MRTTDKHDRYQYKKGEGNAKAFNESENNQ